MSMNNGMTRRESFRWIGSAVAAALCPRFSARGAAAGMPADPKVRGPFPILSTPFTGAGAVDFDDLVREARFVDWCGASGIIWPQSGDSVDLLTKDEKMKGMEALAKAGRSMKTTVCLGVQGRDTAEMLEFARHAEALAPGALISRPPDSGRTQDDLREYWRALAAVVKRPVIIQTTGGRTYKGPAPSTDLLVELAREFPHFGYVKEEHAPVHDRMRTLLKQRPPIRRVFSAAGGLGWLHELRLGTEGLITERCMYADVVARLWEAYEHGQLEQARDVYSKFIAMTNLSQHIPGGLRGPHLYLLKKRGIFKTTMSREYAANGSVPPSPIVRDLKLTPDAIAETEFRFAGLKPYLKEGFPSQG